MLVLLNRQKIISYIITIGIIVALFAVANIKKIDDNFVKTSANIVDKNIRSEY